MIEILPEGVSIEDVDIWFQDEARIGQRGTVTRLWAIKGTRPRVIRQQQFEYAYIFGAVCPRQDQAVGLVFPTVNIDGMKLYQSAKIKRQINESFLEDLCIDFWPSYSTMSCKSM